MTALLIIIGASIGAPSRFLVDQYLRKYIAYPYGILLVNVLGSFVIGLTVSQPRGSAVIVEAGTLDNMHALVAVGFAGAFTTWSTFILDLYLAFENKHYKKALTNLLLSIVLGLIAVSLGMHLAR
ncbi:MAG: CrcB family protein [Streptomycetaceae bacterium]|nr:MAG: CrcB family protein [Streptomycetaceae bacterium]